MVTTKKVGKAIEVRNKLKLIQKLDGYTYDTYKKLNQNEKFAFEVHIREHHCNPILHSMSCLRLQKLYEEKDFRIDKICGCGIGTAYIMVCKTCGDRHDITDYSMW